MIVVIPLYCVAVLMSFLAARVGTTAVYGQSAGVYDHYFRTFLNPTDLIWSFLQAVLMAVGHHARAHLLRLHRVRRARRRRRGGRARGAYFADCCDIRRRRRSLGRSTASSGNFNLSG